MVKNLEGLSVVLVSHVKTKYVIKSELILWIEL